jgi:hypothetical protein
MQFSLGLILCGAISITPLTAVAQKAIAPSTDRTASADRSSTSSDQFPDAPSVQDPALTLAQNQTPATPPPVPAPAAPGSAPAPGPAPSQSSTPESSSAQPAPSAQTDANKTQEEKGAEEIKEQEKQRILGVLPSFNVTYRSDAVSLTAKQKMSLAFRSAIDPYTFGVAIIVAGWGEMTDSDNGFGWGPAGFAKRAGAKYLDAFNGAMIGNGMLPAVLHQDPRYFRLGHGSGTHRALYAFATSFICKHDNTGRWEPNYSNVGGNLAAGAISNLYYPSSDRAGWSTTVVNGLVVTAEGAVGAELQEFWPDISRKLFHKDPTHGLDAQARAADAAAKQAKKNQQQ